MKAFLIDPYVLLIREGVLDVEQAPAIREVEYNGDIAEIYEFLSTPDKRVTTFDAARLEGNDVVYVDDEGLYGATHFFMIDEKTVPLAGRGLVLGTDDEGGSTAPELTLEELWANTRVGFHNLEVRLSQVPVGAAVERKDLNVLPSHSVASWSKEFANWN